MNLKKTISSLLLVTTLIMGALVLHNSVVFAQTSTPTDILSGVGSELKGKGFELPSYETEAHAKASTEAGASNITSAIYYAIDLLKYVLGTIAVVLLIISGVKLVTAGIKIEEVLTKEKENIKYNIYGLVIIIIADTLVKRIFFGEAGEVLASQASAQEFARQGSEIMRNIYRVLQSIVGTLAVFTFVYSGVQYALSGGNDDAINKAKGRLRWGIVGIMIVGLSEFIIYEALFPAKGTKLPNVVKFQQLVVDITNFASGLIATLSVVAIIYGGVMYLTASAKEDNAEKGKKAITAAIIGILIAAGAYALVNTLLGGLNIE